MSYQPDFRKSYFPYLLGKVFHCAVTNLQAFLEGSAARNEFSVASPTDQPSVLSPQLTHLPDSYFDRDIEPEILLQVQKDPNHQTQNCKAFSCMRTCQGIVRISYHVSRVWFTSVCDLLWGWLWGGVQQPRPHLPPCSPPCWFSVYRESSTQTAQCNDISTPRKLCPK